MDKKFSKVTPNGAPTLGKQLSKIELLSAQVSRDSIEAEGSWKPFKDVRYFYLTSYFSNELRRPDPIATK